VRTPSLRERKMNLEGGQSVAKEAAEAGSSMWSHLNLFSNPM
jgi:hypothetical protein